MRNHTLLLLIVLSVAALPAKAQGPVLWGVTESGGQYNWGCIFNYNTATGIETVVFNFDSANGYWPRGALLKGSDGLLYGTTQIGGIYNGIQDDAFIGGTLYSFNISTNVLTVLHSFGNAEDGSEPTGTLIQAGNGLIYGLTQTGGKYIAESGLPFNVGAGTVFSYDIATGSYTKLHDFGSDTDGAWPNDGLVQASNGLLYGTTNIGGNYNTGTIFSFNIHDSLYTSLYGFNNDNSYTNEYSPSGALFQVESGTLYGMTSFGGAETFGTLFNYNIEANALNVLHNFGRDTDGRLPYGAVMQAGNGLIYGMATGGGSIINSQVIDGGRGALFSFDLTSDSEIVIHEFGTGTDGYNPEGSLLQASDGLLYGLTTGGGIDSNAGVLFSYDISTGVETVLHNFGSGLDGLRPFGTLIEDNYPTGINNPKPQPAVNIYPNPSSSTFYFTGVPANAQIQIYNVLAEEVSSSIATGSVNSLSLDSDAKGIYFYRITDNGNMIGSGKIAVE